MTVPAYLAAQYRYAGDDWSGDRAFVFTVFQTDANGNPTTTPVDITGYTPSGLLQPRVSGACGSNVASQILSGTVTNGPDGVFELSLPAGVTAQYPRQTIDDVSAGAVSLLLLRARLTDTTPSLGTQGIVPVFVL